MMMLGGTAAQAASLATQDAFLRIEGGPACCLCVLVLIGFGFGAYALGRRNKNS
ncbi:hypothetical protein [Catellatospora sp. TT07R-123]|uniref:hypothetical protein n=1 Tax=Catellatospora sp. TT07R-123 TaxID=2733863 RepID=UPI001BB3A323|nr:hypothetical protein [Catellatospora sp. TT07R-123]